MQKGNISHATLKQCQCGLIQAPKYHKNGIANDLNGRLISWTKINQLHAGICHCSKCTRHYFGGNGATNETRTGETKYVNTLQHMFLPISFEEIEKSTHMQRHVLDIYDIKCNIINAAFETAESIASLGAIVSIS